MNRRVLVCVLLSFWGSPVFAANAAEPLRLLVPLIVHGAVEEMEPQLAARAGAPVKVEYMPMMQVNQRLNNGDTADMAIISRNAAQQLAAKGLVKAQYDLVSSELGIAVADGAPTPVLKTSEDFIAFLKATPSIAYFGTGASGTMLLQFAEKNGLLEMVKSKATVINEGFTSTLVREGKTASAIQQVSELIFGGAKNIVRLPASLQNPALTCVVVFNVTKQADAATRVAQALTSADAAAIYQRSGLTPLFK